MLTALQKICIAAFFFLLLFSTPPLAHATNPEPLLVSTAIQFINDGEHQKALDILTRALAISPNDPEANYYAGIAASRLGKYDRAEQCFLKTLEIDNNAVSAYRELVGIYSLTGQCIQAESVYNRFINLSKDQALKKDAMNLLRQCTEQPGEKPYSLRLLLGAQDDTNVLLEPSNPPTPADRRSDDRLVAQIEGDLRLLQQPLYQVKLGYILYQSLHRDLTDYNVNFQRIAPEIILDISDRFIPSLGYAFEYAYFGSDDYGRNHIGFGKIRIPEGSQHSTDLLYEYRDKTYWDTDIFVNNSIRRGHRNSIGIRQNHRRGQNSCNLYYFQDWDRAEADYWSFNGFRIGGEGIYNYKRCYITLGGEFQQRRFRDDFPVFGHHRLDRNQQYSVGLTYQLTQQIGLSATNTYMINESNLDVTSNPDGFDYKRNIFGIFLRVGAL